MRDIKFRAWDYEHKTWRYGWLTQLVEGVRRYMSIICDDENGDLTRYYIHDKETIGQFTGLTDRNGVEIYEGDILSHDDSDGDIFQAAIGGYYSEERIGFGVHYLVNCDGAEFAMEADPFGIERKFEVIGNIHEHPHLLEVR